MKKQNSFKKKIFQNGSYSIFISIAVVAILVVVNLMVSALPTTVTSFDFSEQKMFSISDQTKKLMKSLDMDVIVYFVVQSGNEDSVIEELLDKYEDLSKNIKVKVVDPGVNPTFATEYSKDGILDNSLVVESDKRYQLIPYTDIYVTTTSYDQNNNQVTSQTFNGEAALTSAIDFVTSDKLPIAYNLVGHSEQALSDNLAAYIAKENIEILELSLATEGEIPDDCACLIINGPQKEISDAEQKAIEEYLADGGHLLYVKSYLGVGTTKLDEVIAKYGIIVDASMVFEDNADYTFNNYPNMIIPNYREHTVNGPLIENRMYCLMPNPLRLVLYSDGLADTTPLLTTTTAGYAKSLSEELTTIEKTANDAKGTMVLAAAAETEENSDGEKTQIVVIASTDFLDADVSSYVSDGNYDFVINAIGWMCDHESSIAIHSKSLSSEAIYVTSSQANIWFVLLVVVIPVAILVSGIVVWIIRRRR